MSCRAELSDVHCADRQGNKLSKFAVIGVEFGQMERRLQQVFAASKMNRQQSQFGAVFDEKEEDSYLPPKRHRILAANERETDRRRRGLKIGFEGGVAAEARRGRKERKEGRKIAHAPWSILRAIRI